MTFHFRYNTNYILLAINTFFSNPPILHSLSYPPGSQLYIYNTTPIAPIVIKLMLPSLRFSIILAFKVSDQIILFSAQHQVGLKLQSLLKLHPSFIKVYKFLELVRNYRGKYYFFFLHYCKINYSLFIKILNKLCLFIFFLSLNSSELKV